MKMLRLIALLLSSVGFGTLMLTSLIRSLYFEKSTDGQILQMLRAIFFMQLFTLVFLVAGRLQPTTDSSKKI